MSKRRRPHTEVEAQAREVPDRAAALFDDLGWRRAVGNDAIIGENDAGSAKLDIADAIAKEIDTTWAIIAVIEILLRESGDGKYAQGGLRLAHAHLDGLCSIQRDLDRVWQSE
jgi:hypothetical protein